MPRTETKGSVGHTSFQAHDFVAEIIEFRYNWQDSRCYDEKAQ